MSTMTIQEKAEAAAFVMPKAWVGKIVLWHRDNKRSDRGAGSAAVVTGLGVNSVSVSVFHQGSPGVKVYEGVRHADDPWIRRQDMNDSGCWSDTEALERDE